MTLLILASSRTQPGPQSDTSSYILSLTVGGWIVDIVDTGSRQPKLTYLLQTREIINFDMYVFVKYETINFNTRIQRTMRTPQMHYMFRLKFFLSCGISFLRLALLWSTLRLSLSLALIFLGEVIKPRFIAPSTTLPLLLLKLGSELILTQ